MTTRNLQSGRNDVVIDVKVNDHDANRKLDQTRGKVNSLRGPFLGGALLGGFFGSALLGIALNSGLVAQATDVVSSSVGRLLNSVLRPAEQGFNRVATEFERQPPIIQNILRYWLYAIGILLLVRFTLGRLIDTWNSAWTTWKSIAERASAAWQAFRNRLREIATAISSRWAAVAEQVRAGLARIRLIIEAIKNSRFVRWLITAWNWFIGLRNAISATNRATSLFRLGWIALIAVLAILGILILDQIFGWGLLDKILGKFGTSVDEVNQWIDEQIKRFITEAKWLQIIIGLFGAAALSMAWLGERTRGLLIIMEDFLGWIVGNFVTGIMRAFAQLRNNVASVLNPIIQIYNELARLTGWSKLPTISKVTVPEYTPFNQRSADRFWYEGGNRYGPPPAPITIEIFGNVYGTDDIAQLIEDAFNRDPNVQARILGAP